MISKGRSAVPFLFVFQSKLFWVDLGKELYTEPLRTHSHQFVDVARLLLRVFRSVKRVFLSFGVCESDPRPPLPFFVD